MPFTTLADMTTRALQRADAEDLQFVSLAEAQGYVQKSYERLYNILVGKYEDYFVKFATAANLRPVTADATTGLKVDEPDYILPADWLKPLLVEFNDNPNGSFGWHELPKASWAEQPAYRGLSSKGTPRAYVLYGSNDYGSTKVSGSRIRLLPAPDRTTYQVSLVYVPTCPVLAATLPGQEMDTINGFDEWVVLDAAAKILTKEEAEVRDIRKEQEDWMASIENMLMPRDAGQAKTALSSMVFPGVEYEVDY